MESRRARQEADRRRERSQPWRRLYRTKRWKLRAAAQLGRVPYCEECKLHGRSRAASAADHIEPHRGDPAKFWGGKLRSLCDHCHNAGKQREENRGFSDRIDDDGWPADPRHPFNLR